MDDLSLKDPKTYGIIACANHSATMTTASFEHLAQKYPQTAFVHAWPGIVLTNALTNGRSPWVQTLLRWIVMPLLTPFSTSAEECGERCLYYLTSKKYPSASGRKDSARADGVKLGDEVSVADGEGAYSVGRTGEAKPGAIVKEYRENGIINTIWEHTVGIFEEVEKQRA